MNCYWWRVYRNTTIIA